MSLTCSAFLSLFFTTIVVFAASNYIEGEDAELSKTCAAHLYNTEVALMKDKIENLQTKFAVVEGQNKNLMELLGKLIEDGVRKKIEPPRRHLNVTTSTTKAPTRASPPVREKQMVKDCQDLLDSFKRSKPPSGGIYRIQPFGSEQSFHVLCDMGKYGWTVVQKRVNNKTSFYRSWDEYKKGFGDLRSNFWMGNEHLYQLLKQGRYILRVELQTWEDKWHRAEYRKFNISNEREGYKLEVGGYSGNAGDALWYHNGRKFSTKDKDQDEWPNVSCANDFHGGWW